ncbi:MAG: ABC transporter substrate-binding protein [Pseudomonadota bacterium]
MRVVSLLPSATDIVVDLGGGDDLIGVSHSCSGDWGHLPKLTSTWIDTSSSAAEIDRQVTSANRPLYQLDIDTLERLAPDVVISQSLCDVCAVPVGDVREGVLALSSRPKLVDLSPFGLADVPVCFEQVGEAIGRGREAAVLTKQWDRTLEGYKGVHAQTGLRVAFLDWLDPPFISGHWVPEMVELLGLANVLGKAREPSFKVSWEKVEAAKPDLIIAAACGFDASRAQSDRIPLSVPVIHLDGHLHFSRPSPALMSSLHMLCDAIAEFMEIA